MLILPDVIRSDYLAPLLGVFSDELAEVGRRHRLWNAAYLGEARHYLGIGEDRIDLFVESTDDFGRRILRRDYAILHTCLVAWYKLADGRNVW